MCRIYLIGYMVGMHIYIEFMEIGIYVYTCVHMYIYIYTHVNTHVCVTVGNQVEFFENWVPTIHGQPIA